MLRTLLLLSVLAPGTVAAGGQSPMRDPIDLLIEYRNVVERYRRGGVDGVEEDLKEWDVQRVNEAISHLAVLQEKKPILLDTRIGRADVGGWSMPLIGAAALLHADVFLHGAKRGTPESHHLYLATRFLALYRGSAADATFRVRTTLVIAWIRQITGQFDELRSELLAARTEFPADPAIALAEGCLEETAASPRAARQPFIPEALRRAAGHYQRALSLDPRFAEARVRLAFVLFRLGQVDDASRELERAGEDARQPRVVYLARLFRGAVHEHAGRLDHAAAAYREARAVGPQCQVAAIALSHALYRAGDRTAAAAAGVEASRMDSHGCEDPWWVYDYGQAWKLEETIEALHREVRP